MAVNSQWSSKNLATFMSWVDHQLFLKIADTKIYLDASSEQVHELCSGGGDKIVLPHQLVLTWAGRPCTYISIDEVTLGGKKAYMANCVQIVAPLWWKHCIFSITDYLRWDAQPANGNSGLIPNRVIIFNKTYKTGSPSCFPPGVSTIWMLHH